MLQQTNLTDENVMAVEWDKAQNLRVGHLDLIIYGIQGKGT